MNNHGRLKVRDDMNLTDIPISRKYDPATSKLGEAGVNQSGRRANQCQKILARLKAGPATNRELVEIAINYRARISDLRAMGYEIVCVHEQNTGLSIYLLQPEKSGVQHSFKFKK